MVPEGPAVALRRIEPGFERRPLLPLLVLADEATGHVEATLDEGWLYVLSEDGVDVGAVQVVPSDRWSVELRLVAIDSAHQGRGLGKRMIIGVLEELATLGCSRVVVGTSNAGVAQLAFYQKCGFRLLRIDRDHFDEARGYDGTATENGIVHRDLVWLDQILDPPPADDATTTAESSDSWWTSMRRAANELGRPIYGLAGPLADEGVLNGHGGIPCYQVTLLYHSNGTRIEVTTSRQPLGGTDRLVTDLLHRCSYNPSLPWTVTLSERLVMIPVAGISTQFRTIESSSGQWIAAGGLKKRHLSIHGTPGVAIDDLALTPVSLDFSPFGSD